MPPKSMNVFATVIVVDIGRLSVKPEPGDDKTFFERALAFVIRIIERKITAARKDDLISVILVGSKCTKNVLNIEYPESYLNIEVLFDLINAEWSLLKLMPKKASKHEGDWVEGLILAFNQLENNVYGLKPPIIKKIVLLTNFRTECECNTEAIINAFIQSEVELNIIGPDLAVEDETDEVRKTNISYATSFIDASNGVSVTFDLAMQYLLFHKSKATKPFAWNVDLSIGPNINIPVSMYCRIRDEPKIKWNVAVKDSVTDKASTEVGVAKVETFTRVVDNREVDQAELIKGYRYGDAIIPLADMDKAQLYESGPKCLSIYGFADAKDVTWQVLSEGGLSFVYGKDQDPNAKNAINTLISCLHEFNLVAIARRVYVKNAAPKMFVLFPLVDKENFCLSMAPLCYKDDMKNMAFPSTNLKKYDCSSSDVDAFVDLIHAMDLTKADGNAEAFPIPETVNPSVQHMLDCIAFRAVNPEEPLPPVREDIKNLFHVPASIEEKSRKPLTKIKETFPLRKIEKIRKRFGKNILNNYSSTVKQNASTSDVPRIFSKSEISSHDVTNIGTQDPVNDFNVLMQKGYTLEKLSLEMGEVIENLIYLNFDNDFSLSLEAIKCYREQSVKDDPKYFNEWIRSLKKSLVERNRMNLLEIISKESLDVITDNENPKSDITVSQLEDDNEVYENDTIPNSTGLDIPMEIDEFFDEI